MNQLPNLKYVIDFEILTVDERGWYSSGVQLLTLEINAEENSLRVN